MSQLLEVLPWDSHFFGLPIGRAVPASLDEETMNRLLAEARAHQLQCLYLEANPNDPITVRLAEEYGFHLVDVRVVLEHPFDHRPAPVPRYPIPSELVVNSPHPDEMPRLREVTAQIGHTSRFMFDHRFGPTQSDRLYRQWIENACHGFADIVLVARWHETGEAIGLITCKHQAGVAQIQLAGVDTNSRQLGVGTGLVQAALDWARGQAAQRMEVVTQARNVPAQRLYQQMGFFTKTMSLYYHKWL
jgi:ribosomal protein S18 acetylase RimI-like enzyme